MKYLLLFLTFFAFNALAEEENTTDSRIMIIRPVENNDILDTSDMPTCDNAKMIKMVRDAVGGYLDNHQTGSIIEQRQRRLVLKVIDNYTELSIPDFESSTNYLVANELIMTKINRHIDERNMRLCVSDGSQPIYLFVYPDDFGYRVQVVDFIPPTNEGNAFSVFYVPEVKQYEAFENSENS